MNNTYQYYSQGCQSKVRLSFMGGFLSAVDIEEPKLIEAVHRAYFFTTEAGFLESCKKNNVVFTRLEREITFDMFWERYNYKSSGRIPALKAWEKLSADERIQAYDYVPVYEAHLKMKQTAKKYASSYLNSKIYIK